ncbi:hypothetical protein JCM19237_5307 [Photobacterium aphoticum]|uniref:Uncharacterized protein n=1 Tax=Photobacterium aphoticum TaxID=754436 RepID=A0A090QKS1_9GAMM|nr:hypothetical protein JCM19237_5307 [Photobacterium aphoticum]
MMMIKKSLAALSLFAFSTLAQASPELLAPTEVDNGTYELIETLEIQGDINDSLKHLVTTNIKNNHSEYYVISDISEDTSQNTLTVVLRFYNFPHSPLAMDQSLS